MKTKRTLIWAGVIAVFGIGLSVIVHNRPKAVAQKPHIAPRIVLPSNVPKPVNADRHYVTNPKAAKKEYEAFVEKFATAKSPVVQDQVGTARLKIAFLDAHQRNWQLARTEFLAADKQTRGTERTGDFGTVNEQGAYEAIVCLEASGEKEEARKQYTDFIKNRPMSPLCMACYRRLKRLNGGKATDELDKLIESATKKQDANAKFESSVCGPKTLEYLCGIHAIDAGSRPHDYKALAKLCHTTDSGTTISGMVAGLKALGVPAVAYKVNRQDLPKVKTPAIVLWSDHYVTLLKVEDRSIHAYDTLSRGEQDYTIPAAEDPDFFLNVILLNGAL